MLVLTTIREGDMMKQRQIFLSAVFAALALILSGCEKSINEPELALTHEDLAAMKLIIASDPLYTSDGMILGDENSTSLDINSLAKTATPIYPRAWYRRVTKTGRDIQFDKVNDTTVLATVTHTLTGEVRIVAKYSLQDSSLTTITKPFTHVTTRKVKFYRVLSARDTSARWKPGEVSAAKGGTTNSGVSINKLEVSIGDTSYTIVDPTSYFFELEHPRGRPLLPFTRWNTKMTVRVHLTSADSDTDFVWAHYPFFQMGSILTRPFHVRAKLLSQTQSGNLYQRVYEHTWHAGIPGRHHFFVEVLTRSSLFDDKATFSTELWGVPYVTQ